MPRADGGTHPVWGRARRHGGAGAGSSRGASVSLLRRRGCSLRGDAFPCNGALIGLPTRKGTGPTAHHCGGLLAACIPMEEPTHLGDGPEGMQVDEDGGAAFAGLMEKRCAQEMEAQELRVVPRWSRGTSPSGHIDRRSVPKRGIDWGRLGGASWLTGFEQHTCSRRFSLVMHGD